MRTPTLIALACFACFNSGIVAQEPSMKRAASTINTATEREQDGLNGPVRRVRLESAKITVKEGKSVEGPRMLRAVATYDVQGRKIDAVAYPVDNTTPAGSQQYRYDDKGNIVEMVLQADNGTFLGKELYQYEFDELGNWTKMTTSVAVYENGKLGSEPMEITYRTITYYYSQAIDKISNARAPSADSTGGATGIRKEPNSNGASLSKTSAPAEKPANSSTQMTLRTATGNEPKSSVSSPSNVAAPPAEVSVPKPTPAPRIERPVDLKNDAALNAPSSDETPKVNINRTSPGMTAPTPSTSAPAEKKNDNPLSSEKTVVKNSPKPEAATGDKTKTATNDTAESESAKASVFYEQGVSFLTAGKNAEAVTALKKAVFLNPEDARIYCKLGLAFSALSQHKEAIAALKLAIKIKPELVNSEGYYRLAEAYTAIDKSSDALKAYKEALFVKRAEIADGDLSKAKQFPTLGDLHFGLGLAYYNAESFSDAIKALKQAIALEPNSADAHFGLALAYIRIGDRGNAQREENILRPLDAALADNVNAALTNVLPKGVTRVAPREDRRMRP